MMSVRELAALLEWLEATIHHEIPITQQLGVQVEAFDRRGLVLSAPLDRNVNHKATVFGGSLNAVCTLTGWCMTQALLRQHRRTAQVVIRRSHIDFDHPVRGDFDAICAHPSDEAIAHFLAMLDRSGKGRLDLAVHIHDGPQIAVKFEATYVALSF